MVDADLMTAFLNSLKSPFLFADTNHKVVYMNRAAILHYKEGEKLIGTSLLDCHNEKSNKMILEIFAAMQAGEEERLITDDEKNRIYMRAVRDAEGKLLGYYERYEPPVKSSHAN
jgi:DUF438 domain-containing protein